MEKFFDRVPVQLKGSLIMIAGILLLLHTLGIIKAGIDSVLIIISLIIILYGFFLTGYYKKLLHFKK